MPKKKPYYHNNWQAYKDSDDEMFYDHTYEEFMNWKVAGWQLPSSVCCIIRVQDPKTYKVKEHVYSKPKAATKFIGKLMAENKEFTVCDEEAIHQLFPKDETSI